ncbi:hypothetical protein BDQ17DRAFT_1434889 [Cyathus striatus]|nr:hypothetical protein BDQ17DRAFT_1434889 [Cyathus striatus]
MDSDSLPKADTSLLIPVFSLARLFFVFIFSSIRLNPSPRSNPSRIWSYVRRSIRRASRTYASTPAALIDPESPGSSQMADVVKGESAGSTSYSGSPEPFESHHTQLVLAPVPVTPTPVMFDSTWPFEGL